MQNRLDDKAYAALRQAYGHSAQFRDGQLDSVRALVEHRGRVLVVQRTGWGKSAVYFVATKLLRDEGAGTTVIVSPLLALMRDQIAAASRLGLTAMTINTSNRDEWTRVELALKANAVDVLLISPERFNNNDFSERLLEPLMSKAGLFVIDEAHCISDWGHDFRPDYRRLRRVLDQLPAGRPVLCTTATANERVIKDICEQLGAVTTIRGTLDRESLYLHAINIPSTTERLVWLAQHIPQIRGSGIIYCLTVADTSRIADWLNSNGIKAAAYSSETPDEERRLIEQQLKDNVLKAVASTSALGMGFDKPDLSFVIHFQSPGSPISYYQQVGRAGRAVDRAESILLWGSTDEDIWDYFLKTSLPVQAQAEQVVEYLASARDWVAQRDIEAHVNTSSGRIAALLKVLEVEGAVERSATEARYRRTLKTWSFDRARIAGVKQARLDEHQAMRDYATTSSCRMLFLRNELSDVGAEACGRCDNCAGVRFNRNIDKRLIPNALALIRRSPIRIEPRKVWAGHRSGRITPLIQEGRALSYLTDPGWGRVLLGAKKDGSRVSDEIVAACGELIESWLPNFDGTILYVPSANPNRIVVPDFAGRLAHLMDLPLSHCLTKSRSTFPQKTMENSAQQISNIDGSFQLCEPLPKGSVLLVDDIVDSRWTMTVLGDLLLSQGIGPVFPFAIARTKG